VLEILNSIDTREIATAIWLGIFITWCVTRPGVRKGFGSVISAATARPIAIAFSLAIAYLSAVTIVLRAHDLWTLTQLKITVLWFFFAGIPALMDTPDISNDPTKLRASVAKNFKLSLLLDFFVNLYKMPLFLELVFVPFTALIGGLLAVAQSDEKYVTVQKLLNGILLAVGLGVLVFATYKMTTDFGAIANANTLRDLALPIIYNIAFIPLLWAMSIYAAYEAVFCRLPFVIKDCALHPYTRRRLLLGFRTDVSALNDWFKAAWSGALNTRSDILQSIAAITRSRDAA